MKKAPKHDTAGLELTDDVMGNGNLGQGHFGHILFGLLDTLADSLGHLVGFAQAVADLTPTITDHNDGAEAETPPALDNLGNTVDEHDFFYEFVLIAITRSFKLGQETPPFSL